MTTTVQHPDPTILLVKPQGISASDKEILLRAGVIVIEVENPADVKFVRAGAELTGSQLLTAACKALEKSGASTSAHLAAFGYAICAAITATKP